MDNKIKAVAYARVSTLLGQDVENQLVGIRQLASQRGFTLIKEYCDEGVSGSSERRPSLDMLIRDAKKGLYSVILVHSLDRLTRSTKHLLNLLDELKHYKVSIISIREALDFTTPTGQMCLVVLSAVSELERSLISERIRTALAVKKMIAEKSKNGWRCGRPPISTEIEQAVINLKLQGHSIREISKKLGNVSKSSVSRILKESSQKGGEN